MLDVFMTRCTGTMSSMVCCLRAAAAFRQQAYGSGYGGAQLRGRVSVRIPASAMQPSGLHSDAVSAFGSTECGIKMVNPCGVRVVAAVRGR